NPLVFPASDGKGIVVIGWGKRDLTPEAVGCCFCFCFFLLIFRGWRTRKLSVAGRGWLGA
ncbi:hypothetical protein, partial [Escherichia coli]|uniref:hypothetical protein n=1 Tax=Escherichia coli TaxID=562 RepID=UPI0034E575D9